MSLRPAVTLLAALAPAVGVLLLVLDHAYVALAVLVAGLAVSGAAVFVTARERRDRIAAWTAFAANALVIALFVAVAILLSSDSS
jgi:hypothetical protein